MTELCIDQQQENEKQKYFRIINIKNLYEDGYVNSYIRSSTRRMLWVSTNYYNAATHLGVENAKNRKFLWINRIKNAVIEVITACFAQ